MKKSVSLPARTLEEVARAAGVSRMTVSRVLRQPLRVAASTRQRVLECIERLGYRPNPLVAALMESIRQSRTGAVALAFLIARPAVMIESDPVLWRLFTGAQQRALAKGYDLFVYSLADEPLAGKSLTRVLRARGAQGILFGPLDEATSHLNLPLEQFASAACGFSLVTPEIHRVTTNQWAMVAKAFEHALGLGYRRIGLVRKPGFFQGIGRHWRSAFLEYQQSLSTRNRVPMLVAQSREHFHQWMIRWQPDCLLSGLFQCWDWMQEFEGKRAGGYISLGSRAHRQPAPALESNYEGIGATAIDLIVRQLQDNERGVPHYRQTILLDPQWVRTCAEV